MLKRYWLLINCFSVIITLSAQKTFLPTGIKRSFNYALENKSITDTIFTHFDSATVTLYASPNGGFASGNSGYQELAKVQEFDVDTSYIVEGFLYWFGYKSHQSAFIDSSAIDFVFYNMDSAALINNLPRFVPKTIIHQKEILVSDIDTSVSFSSGINVWMIPPSIVYSNYAVGFRMEKLNIKDTIAIYTSSDGDPPIPTLSWEYWNGAWNSMEYNWGLDIDFAIFPIVDFSNLGWEEIPFVSAMKLLAYPSPSNDKIQVSMEFINKTSAEVNILDISGKSCISIDQEMYEKGTHSKIMDISNLNSGIYFVVINDDKGRGVSQKIIVQ